MTLIIRNKPPINKVKDSGNPKPERQHMPNWTAWQNETIKKLKAEKNSGKREEHA